MSIPSRIFPTLVGLALLAAASALFAAVERTGGAGEGGQEWNFRVFLDGNEIGYHRFQLRELDDRLELSSEADFRVRFLFITAYRYRHENRELWNGDCLSSLESTTVKNGETLSLEGYRADDAFVVNADGDTEELPGCVMTFAYWNPDFLDEQRLLDPQTGDYVDVTVEELPPERLRVRGEEILASGFRLTAGKLDLEVWYTSADEWVALESTAKGGRRIRYELI